MTTSDSNDSDGQSQEESDCRLTTVPQWQRTSANRIVRELIHKVFGITSASETVSQQPISKEQLLLFQRDPDHNGPSLMGSALDTSHGTAPEMLKAPWNRRLIKIIALEASKIASRTDSAYPDIKWWNALVKERIYRILVEIEQKCTESGEEQARALYDDKKHKSRIRTDMKTKFKRRVDICSIMISVCRAQQDADGVSFWSDLLLCINDLGIQGTSEEENDDNATPRVRFVKDIDFRHPQFRDLFAFVDGTRDREKLVFTKPGRKRLPRHYTEDRSVRTPPPKLPSSYFRPEYHTSLQQDGNYKFSPQSVPIPQ